MTAIRKLLIANRGEIACRVVRTARRMGIATVAVYSDADEDSLHVTLADEAYRLGSADAGDSYLNQTAIITAAQRADADAIHPGYGFLSENPDFARLCQEAGLVFVGPSEHAIRSMGLKDAAKRIMDEAGVPIVPGYHGEDQSASILQEAAERIGYPVLIKARAGGGGKGMRRVTTAAAFGSALSAAQGEAEAAFGDPRVLIEKCLDYARHIEVQVIGDSHGNIVHLFERDCSMQRRHQKVVEEAPAPGVEDRFRSAITSAATRAARAVDYVGAGTVEFIADCSDGLRADRFYFMEMNTRLQVEHPVTEEVTGIDLVEWQIRVARGEAIPLRQEDISMNGHSMEVRLYAEDPEANFRPSAGRFQALSFPTNPGVRIDTSVAQGDAVSTHYDPMVAKVVAWGRTRNEALETLRRALRETWIAGTKTNLSFLKRLLEVESFRAGTPDTAFIDRELDTLTNPEPAPSEVLAIAAVSLVCECSDGKEVSPWATLDGWRVSGTASRELTLLDRNDAHTVTLAWTDQRRFAVWIDKDTTPVSTALLDSDGPETRFRFPDTIVTARVSMTGSRLDIAWGDRSWSLQVIDPSEASADHEDSEAVVRAPMPGLVKDVHIEIGAVVEKGQALLIVEAMKMQMTLSAPCHASVSAVYVGAGDHVTEGAVLVELSDG